jgi:valyl-tRNA synthetase
MSMDKTFDAGTAEARIAAEWEAAGAFRAGAGKRRDETFCIMIPPPNVTGSLHMGHAFNNTLQDILTRWHRMRGFDTLWQPGQDHAGIATQMVVERELAKTNRRRTDFSRAEFEKLVWEQKKKSGGTIIGQLQRLGCSLDWSRNAFTMSGAPNAPEGEEGNFHDAVIKVFVDLYNKGYIYRGKRLVNWDPHFETAISDLEVEQVEVDGHMWRLRYPLADGLTYEHPVAFDEEGNPTAFETRDYLVVATTRPETMLGDTGIAVHPDDPRYRHLVGKDAILPLIGRRLKIVADSYADPEKGTGAVKMTPAHDFNDWAVGQRQALRAVNVMTPRAAMWLSENNDFAEGCDADGLARVIEAIDGADRYEARDWIVQTASAEGWLDGVDADRHMVPHGDRSKVAIEPYLTDQWFVDSEKIVGPALDAVRQGRTKILPEQHEKVYFHWLENIEPWCISRQLWWGHRIPVWYDEEGNQYCASSEAEAREMAPGKSLTRDPDVLDTWFSSGLWPIGTLGWPEETDELKRYFPTDVLVTGFDIIFFWVARMMMMQLAVVGKEPFHTVYVHALVRDEKGRKMSKSLGNVIDPMDLVDEFGADAVRFTLTSMAAMGRDLKLSKDRIAGYRNFTTKLWNATRFAEMNGVFGPDVPVPGALPPEATQTANRWIVGETARALTEVDAALAAYRFNDAANTLYAFVWGKVCDWYVEFAKPLLDGAHGTETRATMRWVIDQCLILLHPFMPYVTEELWGLIGNRDRMLVLAPWPEYGTDLADPDADREMGWVIGLIESIRSARSQLRVPVGLRLPILVLDQDATAVAAYARNAALIERLARVEALETAERLPRGALTVTVEGATYALPLEGVIDIAAETARLEKARAKLEKEMGALDGRLSNPRFLEKAAPEIVEEAREQLSEKRDEAARLAEALGRLAAMA